MSPGIKHIIIITDHRVYPKRHIQRKFKRTDHPFIRPGLYILSSKGLTGSDHLKYRVIDAVIVSLRVGTGVRIALHLLAGADFFFCSQSHYLIPQPLLFQKSKRFFRHRAGNRLGCQIKYLIPKSLAHGLHRRKDGGDGLPHPRGRLDKQLLFSGNGTVNGSRQIFLPLPIRKWKRHAAYGLLPDLFPFHLPGSPLFIFFYHPAKPFLQFRKRKFLPEPFDLFRLQIGIGHLDTDALQFMTQRIDVSIALRLCQMYRHRLCQEFQAAENALDLVNGHAVLFLDDTVCPALHGDGKLTAGISGSQKHFRLIGRSHLSLNLTVEPAAHLHGLLVGHGSSSVINIPGAKNKLYQIAHRDANILFHEPAPFP